MERLRISVEAPLTLGLKASGAAGRGTRHSCRGGCHKPSNQVVPESEAVDLFDEDAVRNNVERLRDAHRYGDCSARGLSLVEARDHPKRNGEQGGGGGVPRFEAVVGGACAQCLHDGREGELLQYLHCKTEQMDGAVGAALVAGLPCFQDWDYEGVLPICHYVNSGN